MDFNITQDKLYNHIKTLDADSMEYAKKVLAYSSVLEKLFPLEFNQKMIEAKVSARLEELRTVSMEMIKELDKYKINTETNSIEVFMDKQILSAPLLNISEYISKHFEFNSDKDFFLILSFMARNEIYEVIQIAECIING